ncbi:uncharacterized protein PV09_06974 [Verruconis gallopava]|uniref:Hexosyltransferase n=1 Tax=Verruconis gallopava TaxID=253628 RepID=A0A0D2AQR5_9PEZI|nr:uncharacterized protein PV09_06974 [Verruconis gallopava]KIW01494.1 hypothetical protein PV09_06974 [Verruconis gallopava]
MMGDSSFFQRRPASSVAAVAFIVLVFLIYLSASPSTISSASSWHENLRGALSASAASPPWLIATISTASHMQRRQIIRSSWQTLFRNDKVFETRFVLAKPDPLWLPFIEKENATFGDLIILDHEHEDHLWANRVKTMEFFKYLGAKYDHANWTFVSKMDEDSWIDAKHFWKDWLEPRIENNNVTGTYIGRPIKNWAKWDYMSGQFYTLSRDMVKLLAKLHEENYIADEHEDVLVARLMAEAGIEYTLTEMSTQVAFDYYDDKARGDGTAWAPEDQDLNVLGHAMAPGALNPHMLKEDETYLRVAACYDKNGLKLRDYWSNYKATAS